MGRFEVYPSRLKLLGLMLLDAVLLAIAIIGTTMPEIGARIAGWAGLVLFGTFLFGAVRLLWRSRVPRLWMDDAGIHTGSWAGVVEWKDIVRLRVESWKRTRIICVFVQDPHKYFSRMKTFAKWSAQWQKDLGFSGIALGFSGLTPGLDEACNYLMARGFKIENW
jgi:hypothetical protein